MDKYDVSVALITFHDSKHIINCMKSIYKYTYDVSLNIRVISNKSSKSHLCHINQLFPDVEIIESPVDLSHSANNNKILQEATGRYFLILNDDTYLTSNIIHEMVIYLDHNLDIGCMSPLLISPDGKFQYGPIADKSFLEWCMIQLGIIGLKYRIFRTAPRIIKEVKGCSGAFLIVRKTVWKAIEGFDEKIPMAPNDKDLALRIHAKGWKIYYYGLSNIVHIGGETIRNDENSIIIFLRSMDIFANRYYNFIGKILCKPVLFIGSLWRTIFWGCLGLLQRGKNSNDALSKSNMYFFQCKLVLQGNKKTDKNIF